MATAYAPPMASQVMKSGLVSSKPRGLSGASLTRRPRFVVKAVKSDKGTYQVVQPINGDPFIGSLLQRGRALHRARAHAHRPQEGGRQAADCGRLVAVHRRLLLRRCLGRHLGLLPPLRARPPILLQVDDYCLACTMGADDVISS
uniref:Uncharacterized protein n=1 Tax=Triticum urartu TaxID=4572 RepID=A0A8R7TQU0_TRIUA